MFDLHEINQAAPWFMPTLAALVGACVGSFLNFCIYRIPKGESVVTPGSRCACGKPIAWYDNIPVASWLILRGRARCCGRAFSFRYPFIELLTAALFLACWLLFPPGKAIAGMTLVAIVVCAVFIDIDHMIIPDAFTIGGGIAGVVLSLLFPSLHGHAHDFHALASLRSGLDSVLGMFVGSGIVLWIALVAEALLKKEAMAPSSDGKARSSQCSAAPFSAAPGSHSPSSGAPCPGETRRARKSRPPTVSPPRSDSGCT
jgi:leader peptidase (prepilin peptidase) / N-methyltransferase